MHRFSHKSISVLLLLTLVIPTVFVALPHPALAQYTVSVISDVAPTSIIRNSLLTATNAELGVIGTATGISAQANEGNWFKEYILDPIAYALSHAALQTFTNEMINWINGGFEGSPAFVENLAGSLESVADRAVGVYLQAKNLEFLCNPDLKNALILSYLDASYNKKYKCEFKTLFTKYQNFLGGQFNEGGWDTWFDVSVKSQNNDIGGYLNARIDLENSILKEVNTEKDILNFGSGFFSQLNTEFCEGKPKSKCNMTTPGNTVGTMLGWNVTSNLRQAELADEIDEAFAAIFSALINRLMQEGLLALSDGGGWGSREPGFSGLRDILLDQVKREIDQEEEYLASIGCPINGGSTALSGTPTPGTGGACIIAWDVAVEADAATLSPAAYCATQRTVITQLKTLLNRIKVAEIDDLRGDLRDDVRVCSTNSHYGRARDPGGDDSEPGFDQEKSKLTVDIDNNLIKLVEAAMTRNNCPGSGTTPSVPASITPGSGAACLYIRNTLLPTSGTCELMRTGYQQAQALLSRSYETETLADVLALRVDYLDCTNAFTDMWSAN